MTQTPQTQETSEKSSKDQPEGSPITLDVGKKRSGPGFLTISLLVLGALIVAVISYFSWQYFSYTVEYQTTETRRGNLEIFVTATGQLEPTNEVEVGAEISGLISEVLVDYNDKVEVSQVLATIDKDQLNAIVVQAEANLAQAQAGVAQAKATVNESSLRRDRVVRLARRGNAATQEVEVAEATLARAEASVLSAEAQVKLAEASLAVERDRRSKADIRSPVNGIVLDRLVEPGQTVAASLQTPILFVLAEDLTQMELHVDIDEADIGLVDEGQTATFTVDAYPDREFEASVRQVRNAPRTVEGVVSYQGILRLPNDDLALKPGMTATSSILVGFFEDKLLVPNAALRFTPPGETPITDRTSATATKTGRVWIQETSGALTPIDINLGDTNGTDTIIRGGNLNSGVKVLTSIKPQDGGR